MSKLRQAILELIRTVGNYSGCHQLPERSFFCRGKQFPVCARCTGVMVGQLAALVTGCFISVPFRFSAALLALMGIDWGIQEIGIRLSTNRRRFITGIAGGFGLFSIYILVFHKLIRGCSKTNVS